jgi:hypothetical protein
MSTELSAKEKQVLNKATRKYKEIYENNKQYGGANMTSFVRRIVGNRVLELYLKYLGLTTLNSATLVPFVLLLGKDYFQQYLLKNTQKGGGELIPRKIPFFDHPAIGAFLTLVGIPLVGLNANTLVPLGVVMIVYDMINQLGSRRSSKKRSQRGGWGSQYATTLSAVDANAPWQRTYQQCLPFARQSECQAAANVARNIQETINPGVTNSMRGGKRSRRSRRSRSRSRSSKRRQRR